MALITSSCATQQAEVIPTQVNRAHDALDEACERQGDTVVCGRVKFIKARNQVVTLWGAARKLEIDKHEKTETGAIDAAVNYGKLRKCQGQVTSEKQKHWIYASIAAGVAILVTAGFAVAVDQSN